MKSKLANAAFIILAIIIGPILAMCEDMKGQSSKPKEETRTVYMVELDIRNSSFSLDIGKHIRNAFNAMQMEIPVDKEFYDAVKEGEEVAKSFKTASFIMKGSISSIKVTCKRKWTIQKKADPPPKK